MAWIGSPSAYPPVTPVAADLVPLIQDATGALKTATVASLAETGYERANAQTGTSYTIATGSLGKLLTLSNASAVAVTLPQAGASFPDGWYCDCKNIGAGVVTITPATSTIDGAATLVLNKGQSARIVSDATNYRTVLISRGVESLTVDSAGFRGIPQNSKSAAYTTVAADAGMHIYHPAADANARTFTIDSNANVAYPIGTAITFVNETANVVTIAITSDTLVLAGAGTTGSRSLAQYGIATALKVTSTRWYISGSGLT